MIKRMKERFHGEHSYESNFPWSWLDRNIAIRKQLEKISKIKEARRLVE